MKDEIQELSKDERDLLFKFSSCLVNAYFYFFFRVVTKASSCKAGSQ